MADDVDRLRPRHKSDYIRLPDEDGVTKALRPCHPFHHPHPTSEVL